MTQAVDSPPWGFIQWIVTAATTILAGGLAFFWRLDARVEKLESAMVSQQGASDSRVMASDAAMLRLAERLAQIHDDHFRVRETMNGLPTRTDLSNLEARVVEQLGTLAARLDRILDS